MVPLQRRFGKTVRRLRTAAGYSQEAFADRIRMHRTSMGAIERGKGNVTLGTLERIARGLGMRPSALLAEAEAEGRRSFTSPTGEADAAAAMVPPAAGTRAGGGRRATNPAASDAGPAPGSSALQI